MRSFARLYTLFVLVFASLPVRAAPPSVDIPFKKFVLPNGLTVIIHEDHKAPIVAVNVWYHVGSKNEAAGKTGFAHLFEHLMFNGSAHFNDDFFKAMEKVGATNMNGTTNNDRTNYFENVPTSAFDTALWLESDRMGHMLPAIDQAKLDEQRGVVQNEKRQGENTPYGKAWEELYRTSFPPGHPYSHTVIGSMDDLSSATLADVHNWFKTYYGPSNAVLSIAGDVDTSAALEKVKQYFGSIPPGPPVARYKAWVAKRTGEIRQVMQDRVPQTRILMAWNVPGYGDIESARLDLAASILSDGKTSRLYKRLVETDQTATSVEAMNYSLEIAGFFEIFAMVKPGVDPRRVEDAINDELQKFLKDGPTKHELARVRAVNTGWFVRGLEKVGGFGGKSDQLAMGETYMGDPSAYREYLKQMNEATPKQVQATAKAWLSDGVYVQQVDPFPKLEPAKAQADRSKIPDAATPPDTPFPKLERSTLSNGVKIIFAERNSIPLVHMTMMLDGGEVAGAPGVANLTMEMLREGTKQRTADQISEDTQMIGMELGSGSSADFVSASMSVLTNNLDTAIDIFTDVILNPVFPDKEFNRVRDRNLVGLKHVRLDPKSAAERIAPRLIFGTDHPYGRILTEADLKSITRDDLVKYHAAYFKPGNATIIVVGATSLAEITKKLERAFGKWPAGKITKPKFTEVKQPAPGIYLIDKPQAEQSYILAARLAPPRNGSDEIAIETMNQILGLQFSSRLNMNLREGKHWAYWCRSFVSGQRGQRLFTAESPVQADKTREAMIEICNELNNYIGPRPVTDAEFTKTRLNKTLRLPGNWEQMSSVSDSIGGLVNFNLPDNYFETYPAKVRTMTLEDVRGAATKVIGSNQCVWVIVGDRSKIETELRQLTDFGPLQIIDADGNRVEKK